VTHAQPDSDVGNGVSQEGAQNDVAARHFRRNAALLISEAGAFMAGLAFFDSGTVYPLLLAKLGASDVLIGASRLVQVLGYTLPALVAAHRIHGRANHKSFMLATCAMARVGLCTLPVALLYLSVQRPGFALAWVFSIVALFWLMDGACAVSWFDIVAKAVPARVRGRFFGIMQTVAGLLAIGAGLLVQRILRSPALPYPQNFALLGGLWFAGAMLSQLGLTLIVEPPGVQDKEETRPSFVEYLRRTPVLLHRYPRLRGLIITRVFLDGAMLAAPFYVLFAQRDLGASLSVAGVYTVAQNIGRVATGPLWGWLSDRVGTTASVRTIAVCILLAPVLALSSTEERAWLMVLVFGLMGAVMDGVWMVMSTALLESVREEDRPLAVGVASVCQTPSALYGPAGGFLAGVTSYRTVFTVAAGISLLGVVSSFRLPRWDPTQGR